MKLLCLLLLADLALASELIISPSCPSSSSPCTTINDLSLPYTLGNITVVFLPGNHTLEGSVSIEDQPNVHISFVGTPGETTVECTSSSHSDDVSVQQVGSLSIANITFSGCRLGLRCNSVSIVQSDFTDAMHGSLFISSSSSVMIEQVTFNNSQASSYNAVVEITNSRNVEISHSLFTRNVVSSHKSVMAVRNITGSISYCSFHGNSAGSHGDILKGNGLNSVHVTKSTFTENTVSSWGAILDFRSDYVEVTRSNISGNVAGAFGGIAVTYNVTGFVSCCHFQNNSAGGFGGIIVTEGQTSIYVTNSTFTENSASGFGGIILLDSSTDYVGVISSVFTFNRAGGFGGVVNLDAAGEAAVLASGFSHNTAPAINVDSSSGYVTVDCTKFYNNSGNGDNSQNVHVRSTTFCSDNFALGQQGTCAAHDCGACHGPPTVPVAVEYSTYTVSEDVRHNHYALQVCAVATDALIPVDININPVDGTALEGIDFITIPTEHRGLKFTTSEDIQRSCTFYEILDDSEVEGDEYFTVRLSSTNRQVILTINEATVTIVDDDDDEDDDDVETASYSEPTTSTTTVSSTTTVANPTTMSVPTSIIPAIDGSKTTVLVECGVFTRPVSFNSSEESVQSLTNAIAASFPGLREEYIAVLKIQLEEYNGRYVDIINPNLSVKSGSYIKVVVRSKFKGVCAA